MPKQLRDMICVHAWSPVIILLVLLFPPSSTIAQPRNGNGNPKYVFFFLSDGGGMAHLEIARQYSRQVQNEGFVIVDKIMKEGSVGVMTTHAADSLSTDSAAADTALAGGCKANLGALGMCADGTPTISAMELARRRGMRLGLVTNAPVYDASPAAFVCHVPSRRDYAAIIDRYLELEPYVLMGGGKEQFLPKSQPGSRRADETDMIAAFGKKGYRLADTKEDLERPISGKLLGLFAPKDMSFELDRDKNHEPSVYDMTRATIRLLHDQNPRGFFAFIESENIDTASHISDIASVIHDYREFDRAVGLAYDFYRKYPHDTLIIVTSDHETGGLGFTLPLKDLTSTNTSKPIASIRAPLSNGPRAVKIDNTAPTVNKAQKLSAALAIHAWVPAVKRYGATGTKAPTTNAKNELNAAVHGEPSPLGSSPSSSRAKVSMAVFGFWMMRCASRDASCSG